MRRAHSCDRTCSLSSFTDTLPSSSQVTFKGEFRPHLAGRPIPRGEICMRGKNVMMGYLKLEAETAAVLAAGDLLTCHGPGACSLLACSAPCRRDPASRPLSLLSRFRLLEGSNPGSAAPAVALVRPHHVCPRRTFSVLALAPSHAPAPNGGTDRSACLTGCSLLALS